jgi:hypothetical protein
MISSGYYWFSSSKTSLAYFDFLLLSENKNKVGVLP